jgi:glycosyltransferase involved in cell wall biosynthesis
MKIAIAHDWMFSMRGGEKVLECLFEIFPSADFYVLVFDRQRASSVIKERKIFTSFIQHLPFSKKLYKIYLPLMPFAVESFDLMDYDLVISSSHCVIKSIITSPITPHFCYCHSPVRYAYDMFNDYFKDTWPPLRWIFSLILGKLRTWDIKTSKRVDYFIANSKNIQGKIKTCYGRDAEVIHPPVDTDFFVPSGNRHDYYLVVSALVPYKRIDLAVKAFNRLNLDLFIIGEGPEMKKLKNMAEDNIKFFGWLSDEEIRHYYQNCKALIFPGNEDFGIVPVEVQSSGRPVIAFFGGGAMETVKEGITGHFFKEQTAEAIQNAVREFDLMNIEPEHCRQNALTFGRERFKREFSDFINKNSQNLIYSDP